MTEQGRTTEEMKKIQVTFAERVEKKREELDKAKYSPEAEAAQKRLEHSPLRPPWPQSDPGDEDALESCNVIDDQEIPAIFRFDIRQFDTGATRNVDDDQLDYEAFEHPLVQKAFAEYMHKHRFQSDGSLRAGDNWQKGIPLDSYASSLVRHVQDFRLCHRGYERHAREDLKTALCAILFNAQGYLFELLRED